MAGDRGEAGPDQGAEQLTAGGILAHLGERLIKQGMVGQEQLRPMALGFPDDRRGGLQGYQDRGHRAVRVPHLEAGAVAGRGPGRRILAGQHLDDLLQSGAFHRT